MKYFAKAIINSKPYMVEADSKSAAVNLLFENALREYYVAKSLVKPKPDGDSTDQNDEFPMMNLVCLALFKLFGEWTSKGYAIPKLNPDSKEGNDLTLKNKDEPREKKIVQKWNEKHPVSLLYELFPNVNMQSETTTSSDCTTLVHQMSLTLDGATFKASASNKKLAKRRVAIQVLNQVAGTEYTE
ncbi:hypothetical protein KR074_011656 [Drosophila pseudoananassae]|nr:hypothetical protein KR074_011656 [Drosophila pseudoananassae]